VQLVLNLARDAKNNKQGFYRYVSLKRKVKDSVPSLMGKTGNLVTMGDEKAEYSTKFLPQSSLSISFSTPLKWMDHKMGAREAKSLPL